jgi:hypothetical protein
MMLDTWDSERNGLCEDGHGQGVDMQLFQSVAGMFGEAVELNLSDLELDLEVSRHRPGEPTGNLHEILEAEKQSRPLNKEDNLCGEALGATASAYTVGSIVEDAFLGRCGDGSCKGKSAMQVPGNETLLELERDCELELEGWRHDRCALFPPPTLVNLASLAKR